MHLSNLQRYQRYFQENLGGHPLVFPNCSSYKERLRTLQRQRRRENQKTTNQIASECKVSPSQVPEWKGQLIDEAENFFQGKRHRRTVEMHEDVEYLS